MSMLRRMELRHLTVFVAVAEEASFTRAADRLHMVQSAVSASVRGLERELGASLFDRTTRRVELTDAGHALLPEARQVLTAVDAAREAVDQVSGGLRGTLRIGTMQGQAMRAVSVPRLIARFRAEHPDVEVQVGHAGGSVAMAEQVRAGQLDLAFLSLPEHRPPGLALSQIHREEMQLACPKGHPLASRSEVELTALADEPFAEFPEGWGTRMSTDRAFAAAGARRTIVYEVNDVASVVEFVSNGLAVALIAPSIAAGTEDIVFVPIRRRAPHFEISLAVASTRRRSAALEAFLAQIAGAGAVASVSSGTTATFSRTERPSA
jgi:DNA-binding transcriptional LysR family regulator